MSEHAKSPARVLYLHGFNSSPASGKAEAFSRYCRTHLPEIQVLIPDISHDPGRALSELEAICSRNGGVDLLVGSSLGGYYATWLAEKYNIRAALVNPAVSPCTHLSEAFLGVHINPYTGSQYELTREHVDMLSRLECKALRHPENFLLLVQTGDEVLDYRLAVQYYAGSEQVVQSGGNHGFVDFEGMLPRILEFAGFTKRFV